MPHNLQEGDECPLCGGKLEFSLLGECNCDSLNRHCPGYGPCPQCVDGGIFCKPCGLLMDDIAAELEEIAATKIFNEAEAEAVAAFAKTAKQDERRQADAATLHRAIRQHQAIPGLRAFEPFWLRGEK